MSKTTWRAVLTSPETASSNRMMRLGAVKPRKVPVVVWVGSILCLCTLGCLTVKWLPNTWRFVLVALVYKLVQFVLWYQHIYIKDYKWKYNICSLLDIKIYVNIYNYTIVCMIIYITCILNLIIFTIYTHPHSHLHLDWCVH